MSNTEKLEGLLVKIKNLSFKFNGKNILRRELLVVLLSINCISCDNGSMEFITVVPNSKNSLILEILIKLSVQKVKEAHPKTWCEGEKNFSKNAPSIRKPSFRSFTVF